MKTRVLSAIVILAIFIPLIIIGEIPFVVGMLVLGFGGLYELFKLKKEEKEIPFLLQLISYILVGFLIINNYKSNDLTLVMSYKALSLLVFSFLFPIIMIDNNKKYNLNDAMFLMGSVLFIGLSFNLLILVRNYSLEYIVYFFLITVLTDTFAYLTGSLVGRHKLAHNISPKKSVEGLIGGTIMGVYIPIMFYLEAINPDVNMIYLVIITITLSLIGQLGDLVFSAIKRIYKKKDFSNLIPGHGGILYRFDSIIFVILAAVIFLSII